MNLNAEIYCLDSEISSGCKLLGTLEPALSWCSDIKLGRSCVCRLQKADSVELGGK